MTIVQAEKFYLQDKKMYEVSNNKDLLIWLNESIKNGYHAFIDIYELQELIDNIVNWYEIKYPEREMELSEGTRYINFKNMDSLSKVMNIRQLMYRLPHNQLCLMECDYRSSGGGIRDVYNANGEIIGQKTVLFMNIDRKLVEYNQYGKTSYFLLCADMDNGEVDVDYNLKDYVNGDYITLDRLLFLFKEKYANELDFTKLEECIYDHNCDIELRRRILQLVALKLMYSKRTIPERGYERAKRFINEFNKKMGLNLTTDEIDEEMLRVHANDERNIRILKSYIDDDGEKHLYWTVKDLGNKKEEKIFSKFRKRVKSVFKKR